MGSDESKSNPSQGKQAQEKGKQGTPTQTQIPPGTGTQRPWPFDETGGTEGVSEPGSTKTPIDPDL